MSEMPDRSRARGEISIADAISTAAELGLSGSDLQLLAELLGLRHARARPGQAYVDEQPLLSRRRLSSREQLTGADESETDAGDPELIDAHQLDRHIRRHTVVRSLPKSDPVRLPQDAEPLIPVVVGTGLPDLPYTPPVPLVQLRAAFAKLLQRTRISHRIDVERAVDVAAERRPLSDVPREREQSLVAGAIVLADVGPQMTPYRADVREFSEHLRLVVGVSATTVHRLWGDAVTAQASEIIVAGHDRPILLISTLGYVGAGELGDSTATSWRAAFERLASYNLDVVALVPHQAVARRYGRSTRAVAWDELSAVGRGHF